MKKYLFGLLIVLCLAGPFALQARAAAADGYHHHHHHHHHRHHYHG